MIDDPLNRPIDMLDKVYSGLMLGSKKSKGYGKGRKKQIERLAAKRRHLAEYYADLPPDTITRQQRRRHDILRQRQALTIAKAESNHPASVTHV